MYASTVAWIGETGVGVTSAAGSRVGVGVVAPGVCAANGFSIAQARARWPSGPAAQITNAIRLTAITSGRSRLVHDVCSPARCRPYGHSNGQSPSPRPRHMILLLESLYVDSITPQRNKTSTAWQSHRALYSWAADSAWIAAA